jgi:hypothetical protein
MFTRAAALLNYEGTAPCCRDMPSLITKKPLVVTYSEKHFPVSALPSVSEGVWLGGCAVGWVQLMVH